MPLFFFVNLFLPYKGEKEIKMQNLKNEDILGFIEKFKFLGRNTIERLFTEGNCYYFAVILKERFEGGLIYYLPAANHFVFKYGGKYYDICGEYGTSEKAYEWEAFKKERESLAKRIERDCLVFETRKVKGGNH